MSGLDVSLSSFAARTVGWLEASSAAIGRGLDRIGLGRPLRRIAMPLVVGAGVLSCWIWAYAYLTPTQPLDRLQDRTFPTAAAPICTSMVEELKAAGLVGKRAQSPQERAALVAEADAIVTRYLARMDALPRPAADEGRVVKTWLADWRVWLQARDQWRATLMKGTDSAFFEPSRKTGEPYTQALSKFATTNSMPDCQIPNGV